MNNRIWFFITISMMVGLMLTLKQTRMFLYGVITPFNDIFTWLYYNWDWYAIGEGAGVTIVVVCAGAMLLAAIFVIVVVIPDCIERGKMPWED